MKNTLFSVLLVSFAVSGTAQISLLDNDGVARLIRSGIGDEMVVGIIESQPGNYSITAEGLSALRNSGASDRVIAALIHQGGNSKRETSSSAGQTADPSAMVQDSGRELVLRDGAPIRMRLNRTLSSEDAHVEEKVDFDVTDDIRVESRIVIPRGTKAIGVITEAEHKKRMARGGKLNLVMEYIMLDDGTKIALRASKESAGGGHAGAMTAGIVATSLVVWPAAPLFLMMHGKAAVIPEATEITAYVDGDVRISPAGAASLSRLR